MNWSKLPLWSRSGAIAAGAIIILEAIYVATVLMKASAAFIVFPLHVALLFPVMLIVGFFRSPAFLVEELIPPTGGLFLIILFWFAIGAFIGLTIEALRPHYYAPGLSKPSPKAR